MNIELKPFESVLNTKFLAEQYVEQESKADFLTFVRLVAPTLISDWRMGRHIEVISKKLKQLESVKLKG